MLKITTLLLFLYFVKIESTEEIVSYSKYKIVEITGKNQFRDDEELFNHFGIPLDDRSELLHEDAVKNTVQVLLPPANVDPVLQKLEKENFKFEIIEEDLGKIVTSAVDLRSEVSNLNGSVTFARYMDADEILNYMDSISRQFPDKVRIVDIGKSVEGESIKMAIISNKLARNETATKDVIFIEAGIHAREWISPASSLYLMENILITPSMLKEVEWRIVPLTNPDGYRYTWTKDRLWRKNRQLPVANSVLGPCYGVDLNRNFDAFWNTIGAAKRTCSQIYAGAAFFSEPESQALKNAVEEVQDRIKAYITIHSYGQYILYPPGVTNFLLSAERTSLMDLMAKRMAEAIKNETQTSYTYGAPSKLLYSASGLSMDWALTKVRVPISFTFEMRDTGTNGFMLDPSKIESTVKDFWTAMRLLAEEVPLIRAVNKRNVGNVGRPL